MRSIFTPRPSPYEPHGHFPVFLTNAGSSRVALVWIAILTTVVIGALQAGLAISLVQSWRIEHGTRTIGRVTTALEPVPPPRGARPDLLRYQFTVGGQTYSEAYSPGRDRTTFEKLAVGDPVPVFFDPDEPSRSSLTPKSSPELAAFQCVLLAGVFVWIAALRDGLIAIGLLRRPDGRTPLTAFLRAAARLAGIGALVIAPTIVITGWNFWLPLAWCATVLGGAAWLALRRRSVGGLMPAWTDRRPTSGEVRKSRAGGLARGVW